MLGFSKVPIFLCHSVLIATKSAGDTWEQEKQTNTKMLQSKNASDIKVHFL